jgi:primosomal protein N' (replication factor Y) (superfamily II helicase)
MACGSAISSASTCTAAASAVGSSRSTRSTPTPTGSSRSRSGRAVGPSADLIELSEWAAVRWAGRRRNFLTAASPPRHVDRVPAALVVPARSSSRARRRRRGSSSRVVASCGCHRRATRCRRPERRCGRPDARVVPGVDQAILLAARLRRSGLTVALAPHDWAAAAGGVDVVIGSRIAAWAPCPDLAAAVVVDEHDEALQDEGSPTWHARDVVIERCRRLGVPVLLVSPCPTLDRDRMGHGRPGRHTNASVRGGRSST